MIYPFYLIHLFRLTHLLHLFHLILLFRLIRLIQGAEISSIHSLGRGGRREDFTKGPEKGILNNVKQISTDNSVLSSELLPITRFT